MTKIEQLLAQGQDLENDGFVIILKWDGERNRGKKTLLATGPRLPEMVRHDGDDMWKLLERLLKEVNEKRLR